MRYTFNRKNKDEIKMEKWQQTARGRNSAGLTNGNCQAKKQWRFGSFDGPEEKQMWQRKGKEK